MQTLDSRRVRRSMQTPDTQANLTGKIAPFGPRKEMVRGGRGSKGKIGRFLGCVCAVWSGFCKREAAENCIRYKEVRLEDSVLVGEV